MNTLLLWLAQGLGSGRSPVAPGTFGSVVGLGWLLLLLVPQSLGLFLAGTALGLILSVHACGKAEVLLGRTDPPSVVLDEIAAMPLCFLGWILHGWASTGAVPSPGSLFEGRAWIAALGIFGLFRALDVWKPWPIRQSQKLPGGWGITADDLLAGLATALISVWFVP